MLAYRVEHLTKVYEPQGVVANNNISLEITQGELFGIFGPNGAGKTTLVRQMAGLLMPTSGQIYLFEHDVIANPSIIPCYVGYYGQKVLALEAHKFWEVLYITGLLRGQSRATARRQMSVLIETFGLEKLADRLMSHLSGGERRLAALLATFMGDPPILILDEPTNELDPARRRQIWQYLWELNRKRGTTIILVTHNLLEAENVVDRVAIIDSGFVQALGTPGELKRQVADNVRLEIRLRDGYNPDAENFLTQLVGSVRVRPGRWQITVSKERASFLLSTVLDKLSLEAVDDFRLITPSLEEVYIQITGKVWEGTVQDVEGD
ncbi:MAG: ABC transporter ATP-binding protein [Candidatus Methanomethylicaceae archaeon]